MEGTAGCSPSNIDACAVGDLSSKLGTISIGSNPLGTVSNAWTDGNLHRYDDLNGLSIGLRVSDGGQEFLACTNIIELPADNAIVNTDVTLFTMRQRSPFDPTVINFGANVPMGDYQITLDGNPRNAGNTMCYSNVTYQPFEPFQPDNTNATFDSNAVGDLSGKHTIAAGLKLSDNILPLSNLYSVLGHNLMVTPDDGSSTTCGTLAFMSGRYVRIVSATADFDSQAMTGYVRLVSDTDFLIDHCVKYAILDANIYIVKWSIRWRTYSSLLAIEVY